MIHEIHAKVVVAQRADIAILAHQCREITQRVAAIVLETPGPRRWQRTRRQLGWGAQEHHSMLSRVAVAVNAQRDSEKNYSCGCPVKYSSIESLPGRMKNEPKHSFRRMESGRWCQLPHVSGESPFTSLASIFAPASRRS